MVSRILGPDGQPFNTSELREPQTAHLTGLHHEFQGHPSRGLTPSKLAQIMDAAEQGDLVGQCELFEDMEEKDGHIMSEMGKRRRAVLGLDWNIVAPNNPSAREKKAASVLYELMQGLDDFEDVLFDTTDAIGKGFACQEMEWQRLDGQWLPKSISHRPQSWFQIARGYRQEIRLRGALGGEPLQPFGWITHVHKAKSGTLERSALFRVLAWPYLFKNYSVGDLAEFLEIYGIPMRVGKYPSGATEKEKLTLLRALAALGHNAAGIIPIGMELEFLNAAEGDPGAFKLMIEWCEKTQSKAILGGTLTSQADGASSTNALGNVHNEVRMDLRDSDALQVAKTLSRDLVYPIAVLNGLADSWARCPRLVFDTQQPEDLKTYSEALPALVALGLKVPRQWAQERLAIPEPEDDEDVLASAPAPATVVPPVPDEPAAKAVASAQLRAPVPTPVDPPQAMTSRLQANLQPVLADWAEQLRALVAEAGSLEAIQTQLLELAPQLSLDQYAAVMGEALTTAELAGRNDIEDEVR